MRERFLIWHFFTEEKNIDFRLGSTHEYVDKEEIKCIFIEPRWSAFPDWKKDSKCLCLSFSGRRCYHISYASNK